MFRLFIALFTLALPLAAAPAFACGMEMEEEDQTSALADLMASIDAVTDKAVEVAKDTVKVVKQQAADALPVVNDAPPVDDPAPQA